MVTKTKRKPALFAVNQQPEISPVPKLVTSRSKIRPEHLTDISPLTETQESLFELFESDSHIVLDGFAGCGKTFVSLYLALREILVNRQYKKIVIIRSIVPSRDIGFLPGSLEEKVAVYEAPYVSIFTELLAREIPEAYKKLQEQKLVEFMPTSFLRGTTINDSIIVVDEYQNMSWSEIYTVMTRVGYNSKIVWCGDLRQNDLANLKGEKSGASKFLNVISNMKDFKKITFTVDDIVRSGLVKNWIITCEKMGFGNV
jgi:predicted ribonuclease YlaK